MTAGNANNPGYGTLEFSDLVERELKQSITPEEQQILEAAYPEWKAELISMKKRTETQMTSSKARKMRIQVDLAEGNINPTQYANSMLAEQTWRCGAARFLEQVEKRIVKIKTLQ